MQDFIRLLRPYQYIKNSFIFTPLFFSFNYSYLALYKVLIASLLFSLLASSIYIINDLFDIKADQAHPTKKLRPLASGKVAKKQALILSCLLALFSLSFAYLYNLDLCLILITYFLLNIAYSLKLKHIPIIDIFTIACGFVLRLFAGSSVINVPISMWIIILTFLLALFLAIAKRRDDVLLAHLGKETRKNIDGYNLEFINASVLVLAAVIIVSYILYCVSNETISKFGTNKIYLTSFFVILGIMHYMQIIFVKEKSGSPSKIILNDGLLQAIIISWLVTFYLIIKFSIN